MKRAISLFMSMAMLVSAVLCVDLSAFASELSINNRAAWLSTLVSTFDMTVESDNYPDNYFSDLTEDSEYYRDILVATEYGLISVEAGDPIYPEDDITREFAAQTLNACLEFQLETNENGEYDYTFADFEECSFPDDDQIALNRGWFELVESNFCPNNVVTTTEITAMLDDAKAQIEFTTVDENYDSTVELANGVVEIPNGTELTIDENGTITVMDCPVTINKGDSFTAYFYDLPNAYVAQSVTVDGNKTIIATQEANAEEVFENVDIQEVSQIDDAEFIPAEGITVEPDVQPVSTFSRSRASTPVNALNNVKIGGDLTVDGIKLALSAKLSNPVLETKISNKNTYIGLNTDVDLSYSVSTKTSSKLDQTNKTSKLIPVGYINIFGVGYFKVSFEISLSGGVTIKEKFNLTMGESYAEGEDLRIIADFTHKDFSIAVEATLKAGYKFELGISIAIVKADVYASVGFAVKGTLTGYPSGTPSTCLNINGYMYLDIGAELTINLFFTSLHFGVEKAIIDSKNSPVKFAFHFEDGNKVHECTRGKTPKYLTPSDSKHSNSADDYVNTYENVDSSSFKYSVSNGNATITKYTGSSSVVVIPEYINGYKVTSIGGYAFEDRVNLTSVTIPNSVTSIGRFAFSNCQSLAGVTIPNSVTIIGDRAFLDCTSLTSVTIPNSVTRIDSTTFASCENLTSVTIPNSITSIGSCAFEDCTSLTSVTIPNSVTSIGDGAFSDCTSLTSVTIPDGVTSIGAYAFAWCGNLKSVTIPNSVTSIGYAAFSRCTSLTSATIGNSVTSIGDSAFYRCTSLTSVTIGNSVTNIGSDAFYRVSNVVYNGTATGSPWGARALNGYVDGYLVYSDSTKKELLGCSAQAISVTIPNSVTSIGSDAFSDCTNLTSVTIPNSVTSIGSYAFAWCASLKNVTIPNSVTSITEYAFCSCESLSSVTIPDSVTSIGDYAFDYCENLEDVYFIGTREQWDGIAINDGNMYLKRANIHFASCNHTYQSYVTTPATTSSVGKITTKCSECGEIKSTQTIARISSVKLSSTSYTYDGKVKTPSVIIKNVNDKTLVKNTDYTVSYASGRKNVGKYAVKVTFNGKYSGTKTLYFTIKPKATSISSLKAGSKKFTVKWYKRTTQTTGYQVQYSTSSKFSSPKTVTIGKTGTTYKTVKKLRARKRYYVRVRTYKTVNGTRYYSSWSKAKYVTTKS